jgi:hypothetical protein
VYFFIRDKKYLKDLKGKDQFKAQSICGDNIKVDLKEIRCKNMD